MKRATAFLLLIAALAVASAARPALAQDSQGAAAEGRAFAERVCAACHGIEKGDRTVSPMGAPAFQSVADDPENTAEGLRERLKAPHQLMPPIIVTEAEFENLIAYLRSLQ